MFGASAEAVGGRRREALLRQGAAAREERLKAEDVARLERERSAESRAIVAAKFGRLFDQLCHGAQRELADAILKLLARDLAKEVRTVLAETVADSPNLPHEVVLQLVADEIEVARPILEQSPVLTDADLVRVVRTYSLQYALAVAGRQRLSEALADELVGTAAAPVVARLVGNQGANLSQPTLRRVMEDFAGHAEVQARLVRRPELPYELVERLVGLIGERLEWQLVSTRQMVPAEARIIMTAVRERAAFNFAAHADADAKLRQRLKDELDRGNLDHDELLRFLKDGEIAALEIGIGLHAALKPAQVRRLLYDPDRRYLAALCLTAGFSTPHYLTLRLVLDQAEQAVDTRAGPVRAGKGDTMRYLQQQYEALRQDDARRAALLTAALS